MFTAASTIVVWRGGAVPDAEVSPLKRSLVRVINGTTVSFYLRHPLASLDLGVPSICGLLERCPAAPSSGVGNGRVGEDGF